MPLLRLPKMSEIGLPAFAPKSGPPVPRQQAGAPGRRLAQWVTLWMAGWTAVAVLAPGLPLLAAEWQVAPQAELVLLVDKTGLLNGKRHELHWPGLTGTVTYDAEKPLSTRMSLQVAAANLQVQETWIGEKDRKKVREFALGDEVLQAGKFREIAFVATAVQAGATADSFQLTGELQLRGVRKPVTLQVKRAGPNEFTGESRFLMSGFGIKPPKAMLGAVGTKDEMLLRFRVMLQPQQRKQ